MKVYTMHEFGFFLVIFILALGLHILFFHDRLLVIKTENPTKILSFAQFSFFPSISIRQNTLYFINAVALA